MMQILNLVGPSGTREAFACRRAVDTTALRAAATRTCDVFFARTAAAGPASDDERLIVAGSVIEVLNIGTNRPVPIPPRSSAHLSLVVEGWAYRAHTLANGTRQISDVLLPGDAFGWPTTATDEVEPEIFACGRLQVALLRRDVVTVQDVPSLRHRWKSLRDAEARRLRSRLVSLGRRDACERVAHFMGEVHDRLQQVGLVEAGVFECPLTQEQLADVLGLTSVHVNRMLHRLRCEGLVTFNRPRAMIHDRARLQGAVGSIRMPDISSRRPM